MESESNRRIRKFENIPQGTFILRKYITTTLRRRHTDDIGKWYVFVVGEGDRRLRIGVSESIWHRLYCLKTQYRDWAWAETWLCESMEEANELSEEMALQWGMRKPKDRIAKETLEGVDIPFAPGYESNKA